jgi:hypothetical protein
MRATVSRFAPVLRATSYWLFVVRATAITADSLVFKRREDFCAAQSPYLRELEAGDTENLVSRMG